MTENIETEEYISETGSRFIRDPDEGDLEIKYGLPGNVVYCKRCVISNQRPSSSVEFKHTKNSKKETINFDSEGICDACRVAERKSKIVDWDERRAVLSELCDKYR